MRKYIVSGLVPLFFMIVATYVPGPSCETQALVVLAAAPQAAQAGSPSPQADIAATAKNASKESQACIACHEKEATPLVVQQWAVSKHAQAGIGCYECHQATAD